VLAFHGVDDLPGGTGDHERARALAEELHSLQPADGHQGAIVVPSGCTRGS
jgi:hypothetical protein